MHDGGLGSIESDELPCLPIILTGYNGEKRERGEEGFEMSNKKCENNHHDQTSSNEYDDDDDNGMTSTKTSSICDLSYL